MTVVSNSYYIEFLCINMILHNHIYTNKKNVQFCAILTCTLYSFPSGLFIKQAVGMQRPQQESSSFCNVYP